jgi:hypothetical protein
LNPLKRKQISELTAKQLGTSLEIVDDISSFFYSLLQKKLSSLDYHSIMVPRLGTFVVKKKSLQESIKKNTFFVKKLETDEDISVKTYELILQKKNEIEKLKELQNKMFQEEERKSEVLIKKQIYRDGKSD